MSRIPSTMDLSRLDSDARLRVLDGPLMERTPDPALQAVVEEAARTTDFPIALVSLVGSRIQFFRAQVGLPPELEAARATDRCSSFCQFVVAGERPLQVEDAEGDPSLPRELVERYGIRAYFGFPLRVGGQTVGSLCVIDVRARQLAAGSLEALARLAERASARLESLASSWAFASLGEGDRAHRAWLELVERQPLLSLSEQFSRGALSLPELQRALGVLAHLSGEAEK